VRPVGDRMSADSALGAPGHHMAASARAPSNIALAKYWGKASIAENMPAVPSLSVTLAGLETTTRVELREELCADTLTLGGIVQAGESLARVARVLSALRERSGARLYAAVTSVNSFPTASGLASSASGFAALALAASRVYGLSTGADAVAVVARRASASAARSFFSGFAELVPGEPARQVAAADALPLALVVCVTTEGAKAEGSTSGMTLTKERSPYYAAWLDFAPQNFLAIRHALLAGDLPAVCTLAEASALAMHASALAAGVSYFNAATQTVLQEVFAARRAGLGVWATMDAGPHVKLLTHQRDASQVARHFAAVPGVLRQIHAQPGPGATLLATT
jgi:diphosphomevalonate decarboxylase